MRVVLAQRFPGWTLEYIDTMNARDVNDVFAIASASAKVQKKARK